MAFGVKPTAATQELTEVFNKQKEECRSWVDDQATLKTLPLSTTDPLKFLEAIDKLDCRGTGDRSKAHPYYKFKQHTKAEADDRKDQQTINICRAMVIRNCYNKAVSELSGKQSTEPEPEVLQNDLRKLPFYSFDNSEMKEWEVFYSLNAILTYYNHFHGLRAQKGVPSDIQVKLSNDNKAIVMLALKIATGHNMDSHDKKTDIAVLGYLLSWMNKCCDYVIQVMGNQQNLTVGPLKGVMMAYFKSNMLTPWLWRYFHGFPKNNKKDPHNVSRWHFTAWEEEDFIKYTKIAKIQWMAYVEQAKQRKLIKMDPFQSSTSNAFGNESAWISLPIIFYLFPMSEEKREMYIEKDMALELEKYFTSLKAIENAKQFVKGVHEANQLAFGQYWDRFALNFFQYADTYYDDAGKNITMEAVTDFLEDYGGFRGDRSDRDVQKRDFLYIFTNNQYGKAGINYKETSMDDELGDNYSKAIMKIKQVSFKRFHYRETKTQLNHAINELQIFRDVLKDIMYTPSIRNNAFYCYLLGLLIWSSQNPADKLPDGESNSRTYQEDVLGQIFTELQIYTDASENRSRAKRIEWSDTIWHHQEPLQNAIENQEALSEDNMSSSLRKAYNMLLTPASVGTIAEEFKAGRGMQKFVELRDALYDIFCVPMNKADYNRMTLNPLQPGAVREQTSLRVGTLYNAFCNWLMPDTIENFAGEDDEWWEAKLSNKHVLWIEVWEQFSGMKEEQKTKLQEMISNIYRQLLLYTRPDNVALLEPEEPGKRDKKNPWGEQKKPAVRQRYFSLEGEQKIKTYETAMDLQSQEKSPRQIFDELVATFPANDARTLFMAHDSYNTHINKQNSEEARRKQAEERNRNQFVFREGGLFEFQQAKHMVEMGLDKFVTSLQEVGRQASSNATEYKRWKDMDKAKEEEKKNLSTELANMVRNDQATNPIDYTSTQSMKNLLMTSAEYSALSTIMHYYYQNFFLTWNVEPTTEDGVTILPTELPNFVYPQAETGVLKIDKSEFDNKTEKAEQDLQAYVTSTDPEKSSSATEDKKKHFETVIGMTLGRYRENLTFRQLYSKYAWEKDKSNWATLLSKEESLVNVNDLYNKLTPEGVGNPKAKIDNHLRNTDAIIHLIAWFMDAERSRETKKVRLDSLQSFLKMGHWYELVTFEIDVKTLLEDADVHPTCILEVSKAINAIKEDRDREAASTFRRVGPAATRQSDGGGGGGRNKGGGTKDDWKKNGNKHGLDGSPDDFSP